MELLVLITKYKKDYQPVQKENGIVVSSVKWMTKEELESVYKESEKVERSKYGFHIFKEGNEYTVNHPLNKTTRKGETFEFWLSQQREM